MKIKKLLFTVLALCMVLVLLPMNVNAAEGYSGTCGENLTWTLDADGLLVISGEGRMDDFTMNYQTVAPWNYYLISTPVKRVVIESGVTSIGEYAFCQGEGNLEEIVIPDTVTSIGTMAFGYCEFPQITLPAGLTAIADSTFIGCSELMEIVLPEGVVSIGSDAFSECKSLSRIDIPSGVTSIGIGAFTDCESLVELVLPEGIRDIPSWMFSGCKNLTRVNIPEGVTSIGERAFYECESLTRLELPDSVQSIDRAAFWRCTGLTEINIPDGVTVMSLQVFEKCENLTKITLPASVTEIQQDAFIGCAELVSINIPNGVTSIGCSAFSDCVRLKSITIPDTVTVVDDGAFDGCTRLTSVTFTDDSKVKNSNLDIEPSAFADCTALKNITFPGDLKSIDTGAFQNCSALTSVTFPDSVTTIYTSAFENCTSLAYVYFEDDPNVADKDLSIGRQAFSCCFDLTSVVLPKDLTSIGAEAFADCYETDSIMFKGDAPSINKSAFANTQVTLYYPAGNDTWSEFQAWRYEGTVKLASYSVAAPQISASNVASSGKIRLTWKKVDGAAKYQVYRSTSRNGTYKLMYTTTGTSYTNTSANAGTCYYYYVVAVTKKGSASAPSNTVSLTCDLACPVAKIGNAASTGKTRLTWEAVPGAVKYEVYRSSTKNGTYTLKYTTTGTSYTNTGVKTGESYYYKVKAVAENSNADSAFSAIKYRTCDLARPTVSVSLNADGKPVLSWNKVTGAVKYKVYIYDASGELIKTCTAKGTKFTHSSSVPGNTYTYRVVALYSSTAANSAKSLKVSIQA